MHLSNLCKIDLTLVISMHDYICFMTYFLFLSTEPAWSPDPGDFLGVRAVRGHLHLYRH